MFLAIPVIAILKIIFEHIEYMQPWALLLGDVTLKKKKTEVTKDPEPDVASE
jgi:predicted PurR-regulated permease PerM